MPTGRTATRRVAPAPGTLALNARETAAGSAVNGSAARVMRFERGWKRSLPCSVTTSGAPSRARITGQAVRPKWAWTTSKRCRGAGAALAARAAPGRSRARRARSARARPRRPAGAAAPRPGRARTSPSTGFAGDGYMFVTTSARSDARQYSQIRHTSGALLSPPRLEPSRLDPETRPRPLRPSTPRPSGRRIRTTEGPSMFYELMGRVHAAGVGRFGRASGGRARSSTSA